MISLTVTVVIFLKWSWYADDTTLYCNIDSGHTSSTMINDELKRLAVGLRQTNIWFFIQLDNLLITQFCKLTILPLNEFNNSIFWDYI